MRIAVHDYSGHPFQIQLSRALAARGHEVVHLYSSSNPSTPKGGLEQRTSDSPNLRISPIALPRPLRKGALIDRWRLERRYGNSLACKIRDINPDLIVLSNTPLDGVGKAQAAARKVGIPVVYWLQDLIGDATDRILSKKLGIVGHMIGRYYRRKERSILRRSEQVVGITEDFVDPVLSLGVSKDRYVTIPNWAPLDEIMLRPRSNGWSRAHGFEEAFVFLYSGTLGFKHNPGLLLALAEAFCDIPAVKIVVNSQGDAATWLRESADKSELRNLVVNPFQPFNEMSSVFATADVLVSILEPDAGVFSVPSKVLSYHCAGRAMLLAVPDANLASRIVTAEGSGLVADPRDKSAFVNAARRLYEDSETRSGMAFRARRYAEREFDIEKITDRFEEVFRRATGGA